MSCKHGNWPPCELCEEVDAAYESGKQAALSQPAPPALQEDQWNGACVSLDSMTYTLCGNEEAKRYVADGDKWVVVGGQLYLPKYSRGVPPAQPAPQGVAEVMQKLETVAWRDNESYRCTAKQRPDWLNPAQLIYRSDVEQAITALITERDAWREKYLQATAQTARAEDRAEKLESERDTLCARVAELEQDAGRFQQAMALSDNCESLYAAVLNNGTDVKQIRAEFDAAMAASKEAE